MTIGLARTNAEAHLYMELHPCPRCGEAVFDSTSSVITTPAGLASRYTGACPGCGTGREFEFDLPEVVLFPPAHGVRFGGDQPSRIVDAGEWLFVADMVLEHVAAVPDPRASAAELAGAKRDVEMAVAALDEVLKFLPAGADTAPPSAFWTDRGRQVQAAEPGRFRRVRLLAVREAYQRIAAAYAAL
ncbi:hypothetical protein ACFO1B_27000 [Dactylosporangium siamense]|uniref:Uncharacterized protein n=1 Tax=Dactylosporangium siamense TaxID=685454 RepID=A0A919PMG4_9ACTN|nr:hypothetical protein [Dactylosporangium siamense]GIG46664.1 hypothetical protein Dsi01nite_047050 [Dactylosporangium siamense]